MAFLHELTGHLCSNRGAILFQCGAVSGQSRGPDRSNFKAASHDSLFCYSAPRAP
jgi:hypothetical protein